MEKPLENIKNIQASLLQMKARLECMGKSQLKNIQNIQQTFSSSMSILRHKMQDCKKAERKSEEKAIHDVFNTTKMQSLKQQKMLQEKQLTRSRQILTSIKFNESQMVKNMSKQNEKLIQKIKNHNLEQKKLRSMQVKQNRQKSRQKVLQFHKLKKLQLQKQKERQYKENQAKAVQLVKKISVLSLEEDKVAKRHKQSAQVLKKLRYASKKLQKMQTRDFIAFKKKLGINNQNQINEQLAQRILNQVVQGDSISKSKSFYE